MAPIESTALERNGDSFAFCLVFYFAVATGPAYSFLFFFVRANSRKFVLILFFLFFFALHKRFPDALEECNDRENPVAGRSLSHRSFLFFSFFFWWDREGHSPHGHFTEFYRVSTRTDRVCPVLVKALGLVAVEKHKSHFWGFSMAWDVSLTFGSNSTFLCHRRVLTSFFFASQVVLVAVFGFQTVEGKKKSQGQVGKTLSSGWWRPLQSRFGFPNHWWRHDRLLGVPFHWFDWDRVWRWPTLSITKTWTGLLPGFTGFHRVRLGSIGFGAKVGWRQRPFPKRLLTCWTYLAMAIIISLSLRLFRDRDVIAAVRTGRLSNWAALVMTSFSPSPVGRCRETAPPLSFFATRPRASRFRFARVLRRVPYIFFS